MELIKTQDRCQNSSKKSAKELHPPSDLHTLVQGICNCIGLVSPSAGEHRNPECLLVLSYERLTDLLFFLHAEIAELDVEHGLISVADPLVLPTNMHFQQLKTLSKCGTSSP